MTRPRTRLNRREFIAASLGTAGVVAAGATLFGGVLPRLAHEDLVPGRAPDLQLTPNDWHVDPGRLSFVALGDNGSGGRQAMAVAEQMARTYQTQPFGLVSLLGDICYYGRFADRFDDVFRRPMEPLIDAEVNFELAIGNHDAALNHSDASIEEIEAELELLGTPGPFYTTSHGPVDFFYLDSSTPGLFGAGASEQLEWLDDALASSTNQWKVVALHHPIYSSGEHGSTPGAQERLQPVLDRRAVDLVLSGHDHHYERAVPADGITYVVSGGGCKTTRVGSSDFTVAAESTLQFVHVEVEDDRLSGTSIRPDGTVVDRFRLRAREGRRGAMA